MQAISQNKSFAHGAKTEADSHKLCLQAIEVKNDLEFRFLELGALLYEIKQNRHYESGWTSWEEYVMELKLSHASISRLIRIYEVLILNYQFSPRRIAEAGGWTVVAEILPDIKESTTKQEITTWLGEATELSRPDLRRAIIERRKGVDMAKCKHTDTYTIKICRGCGERWTI